MNGGHTPPCSSFAVFFPMPDIDSKPIVRCVNIDWLEVYCLESNNRFPCNADYYRRNGYWVEERDYGTRQYKEMFFILDEQGEKLLEVRRNPASSGAGFNGFSEFSSHIRLCNRTCYYNNAIDIMREFLIKNDYIFKRIYRIDICLDFEKFDTGDDPAKFCRRYLAKKYCKINQTHVAPHGEDNWDDFDWQTISWGSPHSMVTTKLYNKTQELADAANDKPYIVWTWYEHGLITDPINRTKVNSKGEVYKPQIWRVEYSLKSSADNWIVIEDQSGKRVKKKAVPHGLSLFDTKDKLWLRFQDLSFHYFRFKYREEGVRKDRCKDKPLFRFAQPSQFMQVSLLPAVAKPSRENEILKRRLLNYRVVHADTQIRKACDIILHEIDKQELRRIVPREETQKWRVLQDALAQKMELPEKDIVEIIANVRKLVSEGSIF